MAVRRSETRSGSTRKRNSPVRRSRMRQRIEEAHPVQVRDRHQERCPDLQPPHARVFDNQITPPTPEPVPQNGGATCRTDSRTMRPMDQNGLYWPNGRSLFRRRLATKARLALWLVFAAVVVLTAAASLQVHQ